MGNVIREVRFHGCDKQHAVASATLLSRAALREGMWAQAQSAGGAVDVGVPGQVSVRFGRQALDAFDRTDAADAVIIQDPRLLRSRAALDGIKPGGLVVLNDNRTWMGRNGLLYWVVLPTGRVGQRTLRLLSNLTLLGAFAAASGWVSLKALEQAIREHFEVKTIADGKQEALHRGFHAVARIEGQA